MSEATERKKARDMQQRIVEEIVGLRRRLRSTVDTEAAPGEESNDNRIAERYRDLVGSLSDVVIEVDGAGRMTMVSPRARDVLEYEPDELTGRAFRELLHPDEAVRVAYLLAETVEKGGSTQVELCVRRRDGSELQVRATLASSGGDARSTALIILSDVSERDRMAEALRDQTRQWRQRGDWAKIQCIELLFVRGWANKNAAKELGLSEQQVANYKFDFLARLRSMIRKQGLSEDVFPELYQD